MRDMLDSALDRLMDYPPGFRYSDLEVRSEEFYTAETQSRGEERGINRGWTRMNTDKTGEWLYLVRSQYLLVCVGVMS